MIKKILKSDPQSIFGDLGLLFFRVLTSCFMLSHGLPKLQMLLSGGAGAFPDPLGVGNSLSLLLTAAAEFGCSILLILGLGTRIATIPLIITMLVAVFIVHANDGFAKQELGLMYLSSYLLILVFGAGKFSLDNLILKKI